MSRRFAVLAALAFLALTLLQGAPGQNPEPGPADRYLIVHIWTDGSRLRAEPADTGVAAGLVPAIERARHVMEDFFGSPLPEPVTITIVPDRAAFTDLLKQAWGVPETACWMVGTGVADFFVLLSPRAWPRDACEHDPDDAEHVQDIITHELVHVYHGQRHASRDFDFEGAEDMGWFLEGLATYASGQLERNRLATAREAMSAGKLPSHLRDAWSGKFRYGVSGSMVHFMDERFGRKALIGLLPLSGNAAVLAALHITEEEFFSAWKEWLREH